MARRHYGLPRAIKLTMSKVEILNQIIEIDSSEDKRNRVLRLENAFRRKIEAHLDSLTEIDSPFEKFATSPYVLLIHAKNKRYTRISQIESDIIPAKQFSSMETSAGRMIEEVVFPEYGWVCVPSGMHTPYSAIDGKKIEQNILHLATLKSGPRCLNDEMSENFADAILISSSIWSQDHRINQIEFTYGVLYGTQKKSNKKDWHILRNLADKHPTGFHVLPNNRWNCELDIDNINIKVNIRIGKAWWDYLGGETCFLEVFIALIRSCIDVGPCDGRDIQYQIRDLGGIVSMDFISPNYNVAIIQRNQLPWLFLIASHFCDELR